jgi:branched-chain amino acid transport system ATP-binding protein
MSVNYGGVHALQEFDLEVRTGELVGLIGPNGAGKTTFIDAVCGFVHCQGRLLLEDVDLSAAPPHARAKAGLARSWQSIELFHDLTVREMLCVAAARPGIGGALRRVMERDRSHLSVAERTLSALHLEALADSNPDQLTQGQRKLIGVARALAAQPRVVLLDEPAAGLDVRESRALGQQLRAIVDGGLPMLLIDHDMSLVLTVCDFVYVLDFGRCIARGTPKEVRRDQRVREAYLGTADHQPAGAGSNDLTLDRPADGRKSELPGEGTG